MLLAGCQLVSALQSIVSRNIDPLQAAVLSTTDPGLHSPCYDFNDDLLPVGAALWVALVEQSLGGCVYL